MVNSPGKLKAKCFQAIRDRPGILQSDLGKMGIGHRQSIMKNVFSLCFDGSVIRVRDAVMLSYRLYPRGKEPQTYREEIGFRQSLFRIGNSLLCNEPACCEINKGHGDKFYMAFDEAFGLFYIDLKMMGGLCTESINPVLKNEA